VGPQPPTGIKAISTFVTSSKEKFGPVSPGYQHLRGRRGGGKSGQGPLAPHAGAEPDLGRDVHSPVRLTPEDLQERRPRLIPGLCAHDGIGFIAGINSSGVPWGIGAKGRIRLDTAEAIGEDPLQPHREHAARMLRRASS
jgi:hypothetical protein